MTDMGTKFILEYRYETGEEFRFESEFNYALDAHHALIEHVERWPHIEVQVRKVQYVSEESVVGNYQPITSEAYGDE